MAIVKIGNHKGMGELIREWASGSKKLPRNKDELLESGQAAGLGLVFGNDAGIAPEDVEVKFLQLPKMNKTSTIWILLPDQTDIAELDAESAARATASATNTADIDGWEEWTGAFDNAGTPHDPGTLDPHMKDKDELQSFRTFQIGVYCTSKC